MIPKGRRSSIAGLRVAWCTTYSLLRKSRSSRLNFCSKSYRAQDADQRADKEAFGVCKRCSGWNLVCELRSCLKVNFEMKIGLCTVPDNVRSLGKI
jgi:hypothetical protein